MSDPMKEAVDRVVEAANSLTALEKKIVLALYESAAINRYKLYRGLTVCDKEPHIAEFKAAVRRLQEMGVLMENIVSKHCYLQRPFGYLVAGSLQGAPKLTVITTTGQ